MTSRLLVYALYCNMRRCGAQQKGLTLDLIERENLDFYINNKKVIQFQTTYNTI